MIVPGAAFLARQRARCDPRRDAQAIGIERAPARLVVREVRLLQDVGEIGEFVGAEQDRPDVAPEPRAIGRIPLHRSCLPVDQGRRVGRIDPLRRVERAGGAVHVGAIGEFADRHVLDHVVERDHVEHFGGVARIADQHPGRIFDVDVAQLLDALLHHHQPRHHRPVRDVVEPAVAVGVGLDARMAEAGEERAAVAVPAEQQQPPAVVRHHLAQRVDVVGRHPARREVDRIGRVAVAPEARLAPRRAVDGLRACVDDQLLPLDRIGDAGIAQRRAVGIAGLAAQPVEGEPCRLLVGELGAPLDVDQLAAIAAALDMVADLQRAALGIGVVVDEDLEARGLPLDAALAVLEMLDRRVVLGGIAVGVAFDRQLRRLFRRDAEAVGTVAEPGDADCRVDAVNRWLGHLNFPLRLRRPPVRVQSRKLSETPSSRSSSRSSW